MNTLRKASSHCFKAFFIACLASAMPAALAGGLDQLKAFVEGAHTGKAEFTQTVTPKSGKKVQKAAGSFIFSRPGRFRWVYDQPYYQLIVGDGVKLWIWDKDLNQVTVKKLGQSLGSSPAALLAGDNALDKNFVVRELGEKNGLEWVEATPKGEDSNFELVRIGFKDSLPRLMELRDNFGQITNLTFVDFTRNGAVDASQFRFSPPKGADVVGE